MPVHSPELLCCLKNRTFHPAECMESILGEKLIKKAHPENSSPQLQWSDEKPIIPL